MKKRKTQSHENLAKKINILIRTISEKQSTMNKVNLFCVIKKWIVNNKINDIGNSIMYHGIFEGCHN